LCAVDESAASDPTRPIHDVSSIANTVKNADSLVDINMGPKLPKGVEKNRSPTVSGRAWFA
jgi:hypothetical protein